ncbi:MAG: NodT family RND efflux system outer membrane lipoprotein, partial [Methylococcaceae bacterium NSP1-2]
MRSKFCSILALSMMTGCSAVPTEHKPSFEVPRAWTNDKAINTKISTQWVNEFSDSTLTRLVNDGLAHNYDLKAAAAHVNAARQQAIIDGADRLPQIAVSPYYQRGNLQN